MAGGDVIASPRFPGGEVWPPPVPYTHMVSGTGYSTARATDPLAPRALADDPRALSADSHGLIADLRALVAKSHELATDQCAQEAAPHVAGAEPPK